MPHDIYFKLALSFLLLMIAIITRFSYTGSDTHLVAMGMNAGMYSLFGYILVRIWTV